MKKQEKLFKIHIVVSILIAIFLPKFVHNLVSKYPEAYPLDEGALSNLTFELANKLAIYVWPVLIGYIILIYNLVKNNVGRRKIYYPLSFVTLIIILFNLGVIYSTYMFLWYLVLLILPLFIVFIILIIIGSMKDKDNNEGIERLKKIIKVLTVVGIIYVGCAIIPSLIKTYKESVSNEEDLTLVVKKEFNDKLTSNFIEVDRIFFINDDNSLYDLQLLINNKNLPNNKSEFIDELISNYEMIKDLLDKYNYEKDIIHFRFTELNPYNESNATAYTYSGYIKEYSNEYYILLGGSAIIIEKDGN